MTVIFHASIEGRSCIKHDGDGSSEVRFAVPASDMAQIVKLLAYRETLLEVSVTAVKE